VRTSVLALLVVAACSRPPPLPVIGQVADFTLTDQAGKPFGAADLRGKVWVANFIFTRCTTICPIFTEKMSGLERQADPSLRFVSFSVDPEFDAPPVLLAYARARHADLARWSFLTGPIDAVKRTVVDSMKMMMDKDPQATDPGIMIMHGTYFVLVDGKMQIRGIYPMSDETSGKRILADAARI
jgi:protein SCO1/2